MGAVDFTDDASGIAQNGFRFGHEDMRGLALTTWKNEKFRKANPGYNFAFILGSREARNAARDGKYGKEAVVFWGAGVKAFHFGDEESQVIIWGPSINNSLIFPLVKNYDNWVVYNPKTDHTMIESEEMEDVAFWIVNNYKMLQNINEKINRN